MSALPNGPAGPPPGPPQGPQQPRWAWWVGGIAIPLLGILVSVLVNQGDSSGDDGKDDTSATSVQPSTTGAGAPKQPAPSDSKSAEAAQAQFGPAVVKADTTNSGSYLDLDGSAPVVSGSPIKSADVIFGASTGTPDLTVPESASTLAPLPASGAAPTAAECAEAVNSSGTYWSEVKVGDRFCLTTGDGRTAYLRVVAAPVQGTGRLEITVW
ncbi:hypothetical protein AB0M28_14950 [Streptomyces sp. NPDC051940]|uniref:hypothetical protein n=1 Tax=Streptomyces sp. NPDC051940 TaxID=3155675 RepID=UPI003419E156